MTEKELLDKAKEYYNAAHELDKKCEWFDAEREFEIRYITGNTKYYWSLLCLGPCEKAFMQERGISEKPTIRLSAKNYYKLFYRDGKLIKVENYIEGILRGYFLCYYYDGARVLKPFDLYRKPEWHYTIVTFFGDEKPVREVWITDSYNQVIFTDYRYADKIYYTSANVLPHAICDRIQTYTEGCIE
ncbi:MAG: hypothetical protein HDT28_01025 [Clostridiales bacterium]|nr:hypothetical protein [Clostridiales bacterium]